MDAMQIIQIALHFDRHLGNVIAQHVTLIYVLLFALVFLEIGFLPLFFNGNSTR